MNAAAYASCISLRISQKRQVHHIYTHKYETRWGDKKCILRSDIHELFYNMQYYAMLCYVLAFYAMLSYKMQLLDENGKQSVV